MPATKHSKTRRGAVMLCGVLVVVGLAGCAGFRVERDGRKTGDAICDIKNADNAEEAKNAQADAQKWIDKAKKTTGRPVKEDLRDIDENLADLVGHVADSNSGLAQQDIAVIRRNVQSVIRVTSGRAQRYYEGLDEGLSNCSD
jgi:uncharacterized Zn finger protein (UPF0148 family)